MQSWLSMQTSRFDSRRCCVHSCLLHNRFLFHVAVFLLLSFCGRGLFYCNGVVGRFDKGS